MLGLVIQFMSTSMFGCVAELYGFLIRECGLCYITNRWYPPILICDTTFHPFRSSCRHLAFGVICSIYRIPRRKKKKSLCPCQSVRSLSMGNVYTVTITFECRKVDVDISPYVWCMYTWPCRDNDAKHAVWFFGFFLHKWMGSSLYPQK